MLLLLLLLATGGTHGVWVTLDRTPPGFDELRSLVHMERARREIRQATGSGLLHLLTASDVHPPGVPISALPLFVLAKRDFTAAKITSVLYHLLAVLGAWILGRRYASVGAGWFMAIACSFAPFSHAHAHRLLLEGPLAATFPWALLALIESDGFRRRSASLFFGLAAGWMLLLKWTAVVFLAGPAVLALVVGVRRHGPGMVAGLLLAGLGTGLAVPWYALHLGEVLDFARWNESGFSYNPGWHPFASRFEAGSLAFYPLCLDDLFGLPLAVAIAAGVLAFAVNPRLRTPPPACLLVAGTLPLVAFSLLLSKEPRHVSPAAIPLLFVATHGMFVGLRRSVLRGPVVGLVLVSIAGYGLAPLLGAAPPRAVDWPPHTVNRLTFWPRTAAPVRRSWQHEAVLACIVSDMGRRGLRAGRVVVLPFMGPLNALSLAYRASQEHLPLTIEPFPECGADLGRVGRADYILALASRGEVPFSPWFAPWMQANRWLIGAIPPGPPPQLSEVATFVLPIEFDAVVFRREGQLHRDALADLARALRTLSPDDTRIAAFLASLTPSDGVPEDDGARLAGTIAGAPWRVWLEPAAPGSPSTLVATFAPGEGALSLVLTGPPEAPFRLERAAARVRRPDPGGVFILAEPERVRAGRLDSTGTFEALLAPGEIAGWARGGEPRGYIYVQARVMLDGLSRPSSWVALRRVPVAR